jgi:hypothetical protein
MRGVEYNGHVEMTRLELVLQLHGKFRRSLEPIRVTPLQAGVILLKIVISMTSNGCSLEGAHIRLTCNSISFHCYYAATRTAQTKTTYDDHGLFKSSLFCVDRSCWVGAVSGGINLKPAGWRWFNCSRQLQILLARLGAGGLHRLIELGPPDTHHR